MAKNGRGNPGRRNKRRPSNRKPNIVDAALQLLQPSTWRVPPATSAGDTQPIEPAPSPPTTALPMPTMSGHAIADVATCLWYVKTRYFKREWNSQETADDDPRVRKTLGRVNKAIATLSSQGVELIDPINEPFHPGSDSLMTPIDFQKTPGITSDRISETSIPLVYCHGKIIQRAEVFVAVPLELAPENPENQITERE